MSDAMRGFAERGQSARTESYNGASRATAMRGIPSSLHEVAHAILDQGDRARGRMRETFETYREKWTDRTYQRLLVAEGNTTSPRPRGAIALDKVSVLRAKASRLVEGRQTRRMARVQFVETKKLRELQPYRQQFSRAAKRGAGLGE